MMDVSRLRKASSQEYFPYLGRTVTFIRISIIDNVIQQAKTKTEKRAMITSAKESDILLAAWPGEWSQDIFLLDDWAKALQSLA
jgi:hypothetical protein